MREICLDTETTGLDPESGDRVIEIGCVELMDVIPSGEFFHVHINPERSLSATITRITGLTDDDLADKPLFSDPEVIDAFLEFIKEDKIIAHNAEFDRKFLNAELTRQARPILPASRFTDTLSLARKRFPGAGNSLDALAIRYKLATANRDIHGAYSDACLLASVYLELSGGRERAFDFQVAGQARASGPRAHEKRTRKGVQMRSLVTEEEREAHAQFVATLGDGAIWNAPRSGE